MESNYWIRRNIQRRAISRRATLRGGLLGLAGLGAVALAACGGDDKGTSSTAGGSSAAAGTTAPGAAATPATGVVKRGGTLRLGTWRFPPGLDPDYSSTGYHMQRVMFDALLGLDEQGVPGPTASSLAEKIEIPDNQTLVLRLRQAVTFHDDTAFNAEAVRWNITRTLADDPPGSIFKGQLVTLDRVEAVDPGTVKFSLKQPDAAIPGALADTGATMKSPTHYDGKSLQEVQWKPVGTGLYRFKEVSQDAFVSFVPNPDHFHKLADGKTAALLDEFRIVSVPDEVVMVASLQSGDVDMIEESPASQMDLLESDSSIKGTPFKGFAIQEYYINHGLPPMDNVDFRRALLWAWDGDAFNKLFYGGRGTQATSILSSPSWAHIDVPGFPTYDLEKAKMFMERSGIPPAQRKILATGDTGQFQFTQAAWEKVGVTTEFVASDVASKRDNKQTGEAGDIHATMSRFTSKFDPHQQLSVQLRQDSIYNYGAAPTGEIGDLLLKAVQTYDVEERKKLYARVQEIQADQLYCFLPKLEIPFWLHGKQNIVGMGFFPNGRGDYRYLGYA